MKIRDENGRSYTINLSQYVGKQRPDCSKPHERLRLLLRQTFPNAQILEEIFVPGYNLYLDFLLPLYKLAAEADGVQHSKYSMHFHGTSKLGFAHSKGRDNKKDDFCLLNGLRLIRFPEAESDEQWMNRLQNRT